jgi:copper chaperone CopZ
MQPLVLTIEGMSCGHCLRAVSQALGRLRGVSVGAVQLGRAELSYDESATDPGQVQAAVEAAGYRVVGTSQ